MKIIAIVIMSLMFCCVTAVFADEPTFTSNGFRGLEVEKSSPDDVIKLLGEPKVTKKASLRRSLLSMWLKPSVENKSFKKLVYNNISDFRAIDFFFFDDKLVNITVYPYEPDNYFRGPFGGSPKCAKILIPDDLETLIGTEFKPWIGLHFPKSSDEYEKFTPKPFKKENYTGTYYGMVSITEKTFVATTVNSVYDVVPGGNCSVVKKDRGLMTDWKQFPGQVIQLQIISRTLQKEN